MKSENEIINEGITLLIDKMGIVSAEKFITLINQEEFDYTLWRKKLFINKSVKEISQEATKYSNEK